MKNKLFFLLSLLLLGAVCSAEIIDLSEMPEKRIYIVDVTGSMIGQAEGRGNDSLLANVKHSLKQTIKAIKRPDTEVVIITFTDEPKSTRSYVLPQDLDNVITYIDSIIPQKGDTNIADAWVSGVLNIVDTETFNLMFLLTDGKHNTGPDRNELYSTIKNWENMGEYDFAWYVMLTPNAKDDAISKICDGNENDRLWKTETMDINFSFVKTNNDQSFNIFTDKKIPITFSCADAALLDTIDFRLNLTDQYYSIANQTSDGQQKTSKKTIFAEIKENKGRNNLPASHQVRFSVDYDRQKYPLVYFTPKEFSYTINNQGERNMQIEGGDFNFGTAKFKEPFSWLLSARQRFFVKSLDYPPFNWFLPDTVILEKTIKIRFNSEAVRANSQAEIAFLDENGKPVKGITFFVNDKPSRDGKIRMEALSETDTTIKVGIRFNPADGNRLIDNGYVVVKQRNIDLINTEKISQRRTAIAHWKAEQALTGNVALWISWILCILLLTAAVIFGAYLLKKPLRGKKHKHRRGKEKKEKKDDDDEKEDEEIDIEDFYRRYPELLPFVGAGFEDPEKIRFLIIGENFHLPDYSRRQRNTEKWYAGRSATLDEAERDSINFKKTIADNILSDFGELPDEKALIELINRCGFKFDDYKDCIKHLGWYNYYLRPAEETDKPVNAKDIDKQYAEAALQYHIEILQPDALFFVSDNSFILIDLSEVDKPNKTEVSRESSNEEIEKTVTDFLSKFFDSEP